MVAGRGFNMLPDGVKHLMIINGLFFLATITLQNTFGIDLAQSLGLHYPGASDFKFYQFATHLFMHGSFMHIFSNMFALWMFGSVLENVWGTNRFLFFYFFTGFGAAFLHLGFSAIEINSLQNAAQVFIDNPTPEIFNAFFEKHPLRSPEMYKQANQILSALNYKPGNEVVIDNAVVFIRSYIEMIKNIPTVGASGAVFGLLLAFGMLFPNTRLILLFPPIPIKAKYFVFFYGLFELYSGIQNEAGDNVAHWAHLGGMLFGFILIKHWNKTRKDFY